MTRNTAVPSAATAQAVRGGQLRAAKGAVARGRQRLGIRRALATSCLLVLLGVSVSGCVVEPIGGWCYYHPYRCR